LKLNRANITVVLGNVLEYYDFLLFAHIGFIVTPLFFPNLTSNQSHIVSLLLFGLSFITRPIGGYIFGKISDKKGRKTALMQSVKWAVFPALGLALLPDYSYLGITSSILFILLRLMQGIALGGEYPVAGTYLIENNKNNHGLLSSILVASGSVGSLMGLGFAVLCNQPDMPKWFWRIAFLMGGIGTIVSYFMRRYLDDKDMILPQIQNDSVTDIGKRRLLVFVVAVIVGITVWIPMTYSNFYLTKILNLPNEKGLYASFIALVMYIFILPFIGMIFDRSNGIKYMLVGILLICPLSFIAIYLLSLQYIELAQFCLIVATAVLGAPVHKVLNDIFPNHLRGRNISFLLVLGLSFGGLLPSLSSYIVDKTGFFMAPAFMLSMVSLVVFFIYKNLVKYSYRT